MSAALAGFDALYATSDDPWSSDTRWYEERKRALVLAALSRRRYGSVFEAGCGNGHLSHPLASRCDTLLASDACETAVVAARRRLAHVANTRVVRQVLPAEWPEGPFDLVVVSELVYFLRPDEIDALARAAARSLAPDGEVIACDWRAEIDGFDQRGDEAHARFAAALALPVVFDYEDDDFVLSGWSSCRDSVAVREGIR